jgi:hypothetical protein
MTATKLTRTQREVLEKAARHPKGRVYVQAWTQHTGSPFGGHQKSGGLRQYAAIRKLVEMGLLTDYRVSHSSGCDRGQEWYGGQTIYSTEAVAFITEEGRKAL